MKRPPKKADLPTKICVTCGRPFAWRKKWRLTWDEVRHCSDACRSGRHTAAQRQIVKNRS